MSPPRLPGLSLLPLLLALALAAPAGFAQPLDDTDRERWQSRLRGLASELDAARARVEAAEVAYKKMRHRNRARGEAKVAILAEVEESKLALEEAKQALEQFHQAARKSGVPPGWLRLRDREEEAPAAPEP